MLWVIWLLLFATSAAIAYQDLRTRLIHLWLIMLFTVLNVTQYLLSYNHYRLFENAVFCLLYFLFSYLVLQLFYFVKTRKFQKLADNKIGWGDILLLFAIGLGLEPVSLIYFFTGTFIASIVVQMIFSGKDKSIPLAGIAAICYILYLVVFEMMGV